MRSSLPLSAALVAFARTAAAVTGAAEGFAAGVTGGGDAEEVFPETTDELISYLGDSSPRNIVLTKEFDFTGTEGTVTDSGCAPWGTDSGCQLAINKDDWCTNYEPDAPTVDSITYDQAAVLGITVTSNKSLYGQGSSGVIRGKGLRITGGESNIIIQNVHITELNPQYVWGGDAITLDGADMVWIDHVKTSKIGRQHIVLGESASGRVTISNSEIDGESDYSATCDGHHYWGLYFTGSDDQITFQNNYIHTVSGRAPKVAGSTLLHIVNNVWSDVSGHAFETDSGATILAEGNVFENVVAAEEAGSGAVLAVNDDDAASQCSSSLGRACEVNSYDSSGTLSGDDTSIVSAFSSNAPAAVSASEARDSVLSSAGFGNM